MPRRAVTLRVGPIFMRTLYSFNAPLHTLKYPPFSSDAFAPQQLIALCAAVTGWNAPGFTSALALRVVEETYQRTVGPRTHELNLIKCFLTQFTASSGYRSYLYFYPSPVRVPAHFFSSSTAASETIGGNSAFGVVVTEKTAEVACEQHAHVMLRARMWSVRMGNVELEHAEAHRVV